MNSPVPPGSGAASKFHQYAHSVPAGILSYLAGGTVGKSAAVHENTSVSLVVHSTAIHCPILHGGIVSCDPITCKPGLGYALTKFSEAAILICCVFTAELIQDIQPAVKNCRTNMHRNAMVGSPKMVIIV